MSLTNDTLFNYAYELAAEEGQADSPGGMEYQRVLSEWHAIGRSVLPFPFIVWRANLSDAVDLFSEHGRAKLAAMACPVGGQ